MVTDIARAESKRLEQSLEVKIVTEEVLACPKDSSSAQINQLYLSTHKNLLFPSHNSPCQVKNKSEEVLVLCVVVERILKVQK